MLQARVNNRREYPTSYSPVETLAKVMWHAREKSGVIMRNDSWRLLVHESNCRNRTNVRRAKDLWSSDDHGQANSELARWQVWRWTWYKAISGLSRRSLWNGCWELWWSTQRWCRLIIVYFCFDCIDRQDKAPRSVELIVFDKSLLVLQPRLQRVM